MGKRHEPTATLQSVKVARNFPQNAHPLVFVDEVHEFGWLFFEYHKDGLFLSVAAQRDSLHIQQSVRRCDEGGELVD
jgi:hypothetical protein